MATFVVEREDLFPATTVVKAYERVAWHPGQPGAPTGPVIAEATMTAGKAELTGLKEGSRYVAYASVASKDVSLEIMPASAGPVGSVATLLPFLAAHKLLGATNDPAVASGTKILETAGTLHTARVFVPEACKISNIHMWMTTKGGTLTALENGLGLFAESTRKLLSKVEIAALITAWEGATGEVKLALEEPQNVPAGYVTVGGYFKGTTAPTFSTSPPTIGVVNVNVSTTGSRFATGDTGLTTALPSTITASMVASSQPFWVGVS